MCAMPFCARYAASDANCGEARADGVPLLCFNAVHACLVTQAPSNDRLKLALRQPCAQLALAVWPNQREVTKREPTPLHYALPEDLTADKSHHAAVVVRVAQAIG